MGGRVVAIRGQAGGGYYLTSPSGSSASRSGGWFAAVPAKPGVLSMGPTRTPTRYRRRWDPFGGPDPPLSQPHRAVSPCSVLRDVGPRGRRSYFLMVEMVRIRSQPGDPYHLYDKKWGRRVGVTLTGKPDVNPGRVSPPPPRLMFHVKHLARSRGLRWSVPSWRRGGRRNGSRLRRARSRPSSRSR